MPVNPPDTSAFDYMEKTYRDEPRSILQFGNVTLGDTISTSVITRNQLAFDAARTAASAEGFELSIPAGIFVISGDATAKMPSGLRMRGAGRAVTTLKLAPGANAHVLQGASVDDIIISDLKIDGNKANQTAGVSTTRGIYFSGSCSRHLIENVNVYQTQDHGIHYSGTTDNCGVDSVVRYCLATEVGSSSHTGAGGAGGTGFAGGCSTMRWEFTTARGCYLNGHKSQGYHLRSQVFDSVRGGFEGGFSVTDSKLGTTYEACTAYNCGLSGFRFQGELDEITMLACRAELCGESGVLIYGGSKYIVIRGGTFKNNGRLNASASTRSSTSGRDGISILTYTATDPIGVTIDSVRCSDDQGTQTQDYGIYVDNNAAGVDICGVTDVSTNKLQGIYRANAADVRILPGTKGHTGEATYPNDITLTGSTSALDFMTHTVAANARGVGSKLKVNGSFGVSGTAGAKTIRCFVGGASFTIAGYAAADTVESGFSIEIEWVETTRLKITGVVYRSTLATSTVGFQVSISSGAAVDIKTQVTLGSAADSVTQRWLSVETIR